jgi:hypothetical protein
LRPGQIFGVVDLGAHQILHAHWIDDERYALILDPTVTVFDVFVERETVLKSGTTTTGYEDPQFELGIVFFPDQFADLTGRRISKD